MPSLKYKVIKSRSQYREYCRSLDLLLEKNNRKFKDEIELLTVLIEKWDADHQTFHDSDPVELLRSLMLEKNLKANDLATILGVGKSVVSEILNYKKGISKKIVRDLSQYFSVSQEAFNRNYKLISKLTTKKNKLIGSNKIKASA